MYSTKHLTALGMIVVGCLGSPVCYAADDQKPGLAQEVRTTLYKWTDKDSLVVSFKKGQTSLSASEKKRIAALFEAQRKNGNKEVAVMVAAWPDADYNTKNRTAQSATPAEVALADKRMEAVKAALVARNVPKVDVVEEYNMAKEPSAVAKYFETKDSLVKEGVVNDDKSSSTSASVNKDIEKLIDDGGASKVVLAVKVK